MGRTRIYLACSLDGFIAGPGDDLAWLAPEEGAGDPAADGALDFYPFLAECGAMLMGRRTFDVALGFGQWAYGELPVLVATHRPLPELAPGTVRAVSGDIRELLAEAREVAGERDVYVDGGAIARQALDAGLVDEMVLTIVPVLLGGGVSLFGGLTDRSWWRFTDHRSYGSMVQLRLEPKPR
ncbi:MAG: dihydrofolate reductase [Deltaproteobacteria bacterium]|nr:MAG: dihydrofolate reductase [Deltaproteobacteria bacterium]